MKIGLVHKKDIELHWHHIEAWVDTARGIDKTSSVEDIKRGCLSGEYHLWIIQDVKEYLGFCIGSIAECPQGRMYYLSWLGGKDLARWVASGIELVEAFAKGNKCIAISFVGRKVWKKLVNYDYEGTYYYKNL